MSSSEITLIHILCSVLLLQLRLVLCSEYCMNRTHFNMTFTSETRIDKVWFASCAGGQYFNLSSNEITSVQNDSFDTLWNVQTLDLSNNKISEIESFALANMRNLHSLDLSHNELTELPIGFFDNKNKLVTVDISYNKITHIPLPVFNYSMPNIKEVLLHHNLLTSFEPWAYVRESFPLDLRDNNISTFTNDYNYTYLPRTVYEGASTDLQNNSISDWHDWYLLQYYPDPSAKDIGIDAVMVAFLADIRENPFICDCNTHNLIGTVRQSFFRWSNSDYLDVTCHDPPRLRGKYAFYDVSLEELVCNISVDCPTGCLCQDRPEQGILNVDCRGLNLTMMPVALPKSPYGKIELQLDNNDIRNIINTTYLPYITKLFMQENPLTTLPGFVIDGIASKENGFVDFRNNSLISIPVGTQNIKFQNVLLNGNNLECSCDMMWMVDWINLAPRYADKRLSCYLKEELYEIIHLNENILNCHDVGSIILIVALSAVLLIVIALLITAKRCPYETKVILYKIFRIHPSDNYSVDRNVDTSYDMYISFDENDTYVTRWIMKVLFRQLEGKKPFYKLSVFQRNAPPGSEDDARVQLIDESRRLLIVLSIDYENNEWCDYELCQSETLEQNDGRVIYLLYDKNAKEKMRREPWVSRMKGRRVIDSTDKMLWAKLRYELPRKPFPRLNARNTRQEFRNIE